MGWGAGSQHEPGSKKARVAPREGANKGGGDEGSGITENSLTGYLVFGFCSIDM
jgi:hypothetical protein